jgi:hypothetical protein
MAGITTIRISTDMRDDLKGLGYKGETYEEILGRLVKQARLLAVYDREKRILEREEFAPFD